MRTDMVVSYVRDLLEHLTGTRPEPDEDGDLLIAFGGATFYARVVNPGDPIVQIFSVAVAELPETPELFAAINEINLNIGFARAFWVRDQLLIEAEIWGSDINPSNFRYACGNIASVTDLHGPQVIERFGGKPRFEDLKEPEYDQGTLFRAESHGAYL